MIHYDSYKMRQILLQNVKVILLQNLISQVYYKMSQVFFYKMEQFYYKMRQLLQNVKVFRKLR